MTLKELAKMRRIRARPALPIVMTDDSEVHEFCTLNDIPVMWIPGLQEEDDLSPLNNLDVWFIANGDCKDILANVKEHEPASLWITGFYGFTDKVSKIVGRPIWTS